MFRHGILLFGAWLVLAIGIFALAVQNLSVPGLYYDEAVFAGLAKDFISGQHRLHTPGFEIISIFNRPFPLFVQFYLGALKSWLAMPSLALFGNTVTVVRLTSLFWALIALLFFMLATRRWLGLRGALIAGAVLAIDPTFFFLGVFDWGAAISSLLCRCVAFYLFVVWWQRRRSVCLFLAAFFTGLGFFNKIDFAAVIVGSGVSALVFYHAELWKLTRAQPRLIGILIAGLLLGAGPMTFKLNHIMNYTATGQASAGANELSDKLHTLIAIYDGSYFDRLMNVGGVFEKMYEQPAGVQSLFWLMLSLAIISLGMLAACRLEAKRHKSAGFLLLAFILTTLAILATPGAVRIHHAVLAFPFPQLLIATACVFLWESNFQNATARLIRLSVVVGLVILFASQVRLIETTEKLMTETGGRGRWSNAFDQFCLENRNRTDLTIISLDWGFNEQLAFLTNGPQLVEPFWALQTRPGPIPPLPAKPSNIYLVHPPDYSLLHFDISYLEDAQRRDDAEVRNYADRQGRPVFYTIRFRE